VEMKQAARKHCHTSKTSTMSRFSVIQNSSDNWNERKPFF